MKICGTIQKFRNQIFCIDKFRNRNYNKRVRKITIQKPARLSVSSPAHYVDWLTTNEAQKSVGA